MKAELRVDLGFGTYGPGDQVSGDVVVVAGGECRDLKAALVYAEHTADYEGATIRIESPPLASGTVSTGQVFPFELVLPPDALPNQHSPHGSVEWRVVAGSATVALPLTLPAVHADA